MTDLYVASASVRPEPSERAADEVLALINRTIENLDERRKIKYWVAPDSIRDGSELREKTQHMVDPDDLFYAVELLRAVAKLQVLAGSGRTLADATP